MAWRQLPSVRPGRTAAAVSWRRPPSSSSCRARSSLARSLALFLVCCCCSDEERRRKQVLSENGISSAPLVHKANMDYMGFVDGSDAVRSLVRRAPPPPASSSPRSISSFSLQKGSMMKKQPRPPTILVESYARACARGTAQQQHREFPTNGEYYGLRIA